MVKTVGVLALQGAFKAHQKHIEASGLQYKEIRKEEDFRGIDALIIPGGESSTMLRLLNVLELEKAFEDCIKTVPTWGICAGSILLAKNVRESDQKCFSLLDIEVKRNAYGRQAESFNDEIASYEVAFIRAPIIEEIDPTKVKVLAQSGEKPVWIMQDKNMATTFHPELNPQTPSPMHRHFFATIL